MVIDPLRDGISSVELIDHMGSDLTVVNAARVSYAAESREFTGRDAKLINYLMRCGHGSPFEHVILTFRVKAPLYVVAQWQRHRIASYNQRSGRYVEFTEEFYVPENNQKIIDHYQRCYELYLDLMANGMHKEKARAVLPTGLYTEFWFTVNLRSLLNFLMVRNDSHAQEEIRAYAIAIESAAGAICPEVISAFETYGRVAP